MASRMTSHMTSHFIYKNILHYVTSCGHKNPGISNFAGCDPSASLTSLPNVVVIILVEDLFYI